MFKLKQHLLVAIAVLSIGLVACKKDEPEVIPTPVPTTSVDGVFIGNEGSWNQNNASLSYYNPTTKEIENEVFLKATGVPVGDVLQSLNIQNDLLYMVVNNSGKIYVMNTKTRQHAGTIEGLSSPRYIHFLDNDEMYITDLYEAGVNIASVSSLSLSGKVATGTHKTEQMVAYDKYVFTNAWSFDNMVLVIDTETNETVDSITVPIQPNSMVLDKNNKLWVLTDGGYEGSTYGHEEGALVCIDAKTREIEKSLRFPLADNPKGLCINGTQDTLYFINKNIYRMAVTATELPANAFVATTNTNPYGGFYSIAVDPVSSEIYASDALDYQQAGTVIRYTAQGIEVDSFTAGVIPGSFCFKTTTAK